MIHGSPNYIFQRQEHTCGPVAMYNASLWQTGCVPDLPKLIAACAPTHDFGTASHRMFGDTVAVLTSKPTRMRGWLDSGCGFVLLHQLNEEEAHYVFVHPHHHHSSTRPRFMVRNAIDDVRGYRHVFYKQWHAFAKKYLQPMGPVYISDSECPEYFPRAWLVKKK